MWSNSLNVFSKPNVSLDAQLRRSPDKEIKKMVILLLDVLVENLSLGTFQSDQVVRTSDA